MSLCRDSRDRRQTHVTECPPRSAHTIKVTAASPLSVPRLPQQHERAQSKEDKNKLNSMRATSSSDDQQQPWQHASGRDSVDYHQYLEKIEKFRVNNPKVKALLHHSIPVKRKLVGYFISDFLPIMCHAGAGCSFADM